MKYQRIADRQKYVEYNDNVRNQKRISELEKELDKLSFPIKDITNIEYVANLLSEYKHRTGSEYKIKISKENNIV